MRPDRDLPLEAASRKAPVPGESLPQRTVGVGWIAAKQPRQPTHGSAFARRARFGIFREQRAQGRGFLSVEHAAACGPLAAFGQRHHDAVQGLDILLARLHAREDVAQIDQHRGALVQRSKIFDGIELALEICEEGLHLFLAGRLRFPRHGEGKHAAGCKLEPFVGDQRDRLGQVERCKRRIDRKRDDAVGQRDLVVLEAIALAPEKHGHVLARGHVRRQEGGRLVRAEHGLRLVVGARRRGQNDGAVGDGRRQIVEQRGVVENAVGARGRALRVNIGPAVARLDEPQPPESEIRHDAGRRADVLAELRLDQDDDRPGVSIQFLVLSVPAPGMAALVPRAADRARPSPAAMPRAMSTTRCSTSP